MSCSNCLFNSVHFSLKFVANRFWVSILGIHTDNLNCFFTVIILNVELWSLMLNDKDCHQECQDRKYARCRNDISERFVLLQSFCVIFRWKHDCLQFSNEDCNILYHHIGSHELSKSADWHDFFDISWSCNLNKTSTSKANVRTKDVHGVNDNLLDES